MSTSTLRLTPAAHLESSLSAEGAGPRLPPIERPRSWRLRLVYALLRRRFGKVITPIRVINARMPKSFRAAYEIARFEERGLHLDAGLKALLKTHVAALNGCSFCVDIARWQVQREEELLAQLDALPDYSTSPLFSPRERAVLAYVEEVTRTHHASDATFAALRAHASERDIAEITWLCAVENYYNLLNLPLGITSDGLCALNSQP